MAWLFGWGKDEHEYTALEEHASPLPGERDEAGCSSAGTMAPPSSGVGDLICLLDTPPRCQPNIDTFAAIGAVATVASSAADPAGNALPCGAACAASSNATELPDYLRNNAADGVLAAEPRILFLYAIPLCRGELIYLPATSGGDEEVPPGATSDGSATAGSGPSGSGASGSGGLLARAQRTASSTWLSLSEAEPGSVKHRLYQAGQRLLDSVPPEERLMRGIPTDITKVVIFHPAAVPPDAIAEQLTSASGRYGVTAAGKALAAGLFLPIAFGIDIIILPGPQMLTYYSMWELWRNATGAAGNARFARYLGQSGGAGAAARVNYAPDPRLDRYADAAAASPEGCLCEEEIDALCEELCQPGLVQPLLELRRRHLRATLTTREEYALLPSDPH